ncbi:hypothetical protein IKE87_02340 [Candidatus Saccharibacteria bacterium]|nr:hypothetical protein [Candidatus Saccharibacteria bacterium]
MKRIFSPIIITCLFILSFFTPFFFSTDTFAAKSTTMTKQECTRRSGTYDDATKTCTYENDADRSGNSAGSVQGYTGHSDGDCSFIGFVAWDCKIGPMNTESAIRSGIWQIAANIATDISVAAAYLVLGYTIYGGYLYMLSGGDASKVAAGKKTLSHAFIGLAITMLASTIMSTIRIVLAVNNGNLSCDFTTGTNCLTNANVSQMVTNTIQWFFGFAGIVAVVFVLIGGVSYMTSAGDPGKIKQAKQTITYALIGLAIVGLAEVITAFVSNLIRDADNKANASTHLISPPPSHLKDNSLATHYSHSIDIKTIKEPHA